MSFYPQVWLNYTRQSVRGLSFEFLAYNATGFFFYSIFNVVTFVEQRRLHLDAAVEPNDVAFALRALLITLVTIGQCLVYERGGQRVNRAHVVVILALWLLAAYNVVLCLLGILPWAAHVKPGTEATFQYTLMQYFGLSKGFISFIKYVPQAYFNYQRKSTVSGLTDCRIPFQKPSADTFAVLNRWAGRLETSSWTSRVAFFRSCSKLRMPIARTIRRSSPRIFPSCCYPLNQWYSMSCLWSSTTCCILSELKYKTR